MRVVGNTDATACFSFFSFEKWQKTGFVLLV